MTAAGTTGTTCSAIGKPEAALFEQPDHAVGGSETVGAPTGESDGVDLLDEVLRSERVGLAGAGPATADVDAGRRAAGHGDHGRAGLPPGSGPLVMAHTDPGHVEDRSERRADHRRVIPGRASSP